MYSIAGRCLPVASHGWVNPTRTWDQLADDVFSHTYALRAGDTVVDIGAGIGTEAMYYADRIGSGGMMVLIEAHPRTYASLRSLLSLNFSKGRGPEVISECIGVSDHIGEARLSDVSNNETNRLVADGGIRVTTTTLDHLVQKHHLRRIDFLKMNIEGAEGRALGEAKHALSITQHGAIGCHDFLADEYGDPRMRTKDMVRAVLTEAGFSITERPDARDPWTRDYLYFDRVY